MTDRPDAPGGALASVIEPVVASLGLELFDLELSGSARSRTLRVVIDRDGGVDLDTITAATEAISPVLDHAAALSGPYALEVSSPGLERPLRNPAHFRRVIGATVSVKTRDADGVPRRIRGTLVAAGDDAITVDADGERQHIDYRDVSSARTVFEWGPVPKPAERHARRRTKKEATRS